MVDGLRAGRRRAPESLAGGVLAAVGLVDSWTEIPGSIGPLYVAWGSRGVTAVGQGVGERPALKGRPDRAAADNVARSRASGGHEM